MIVVKLTQSQANSLKGKEVVKDNYFNPIQDKNGNWIISVEERDQCDLEWVKNCPEITYEPIEVNFPI